MQQRYQVRDEQQVLEEKRGEEDGIEEKEENKGQGYCIEYLPNRDTGSSSIRSFTKVLIPSPTFV